jgi:hypothetical protein
MLYFGRICQQFDLPKHTLNVKVVFKIVISNIPKFIVYLITADVIFRMLILKLIYHYRHCVCKGEFVCYICPKV